VNVTFKIAQLSSDPAISDRIGSQLFSFRWAVRLDEATKQDLIKLVLEVIRKLESVKYHRDNLHRIVQSELQSRGASAEPSAVLVVDMSTGAEKELEAMLLQAKASIDVMVKVLQPLAGINLATYADGGKKVLKALKNNLPKDIQGRADWLIALVETGVPWIEQWVGSYRDTVAHYRTIESSGFVGVPDVDGQLQFSAPSDRSGVPLTEFADALLEDLLVFCEDFLTYAYRLRIPPSLEIRPASTDRLMGKSSTKYVLVLP
jgi:hypothetical protein